jgi:hypothetical protein
MEAINIQMRLEVSSPSSMEQLLAASLVGRLNTLRDGPPRLLTDVDITHCRLPGIRCGRPQERNQISI